MKITPVLDVNTLRKSLPMGDESEVIVEIEGQTYRIESVTAITHKKQKGKVIINASPTGGGLTPIRGIKDLASYGVFWERGTPPKQKEDAD